MKFILLAFVVPFLTTEGFAQKFVYESGKPTKSYDKIWSFINGEIGSCPAPINFAQDLRKDSFSRFNGNPPKVVMAIPPSSEQFNMVLAHETSHVCLFAKTNGMSNQNRFRFFDEGLADILGGRLIGGESNYRKKAFTIAKAKVLSGQVSFQLAQDWKSYFGTPPKVDFDAYKVGATFIYFIVDQHGQKKLAEFFSSIAKTQSLDKTIRAVFEMKPSKFESAWISYIQNQK